MRLKNKRSGFTLLEIIIVIIIVGVLASLALPRFFQTVEFSRSNEAMNILSSAKRAADRCSIMGGAAPDYTVCTSWGALAMDPPGAVPNSHFCYDDPVLVAGVWTAIASRNDVDNGSGTPCVAVTGFDGAGPYPDQITFDLTVATGALARSGTGVFAGIQ